MFSILEMVQDLFLDMCMVRVGPKLVMVGFYNLYW